MRNEIAPSLDQMQLIDPKSGLPIARITSGNQVSTPLPMHARNEPGTKVDPLSHSDYNQNSKRSGNGDSSNQIAEADAAFEAMTVAMADDTQTVPNPDDQLGKLYTCYDWANHGKCSFGRECHFEHYNTGHVAPPGNRIDPAEITCWFWFHAKCRKPVRKCKFNHEKKRYLAQKDGRPSQT